MPTMPAAMPANHATVRSVWSNTGAWGSPLPPKASRTAISGIEARITAALPAARIRASGGTRSSSPRITAWASHGRSGATPVQLAP